MSMLIEYNTQCFSHSIGFWLAYQQDGKLSVIACLISYSIYDVILRVRPIEANKTTRTQPVLMHSHHILKDVK